MKSRLVVLIALGLACVLAAGGGAYLAVRQSMQSSSPVQAAAQPTVTPSSTAAAAPPSGLVTTPPAPGDNTPVGSAASAAPDTGSLSAAPVHERAKSARRARPEPSAPALDSSSAVQSQPDASRAGAPPAGTEASVPQPPPAPQPQSISQAPAEPAREWVEVTVPAETVLGLQIQTAVSSETARIEDRVEARVTRDVRIDDRVAIPAGSQAIGSVVQVERGGKLKDRAHFAIRFNSLILPDGNRLALTAEAVHREGPSPANKSAARIGGATVGGAILGAILGGGKGAAIGGAIGAGGGTAATMASDRQPATLPAGSIVNIRLMSPVSVTLER